MELNGNVYKASVKSTQSDNYTACLCCLHAETNVLSEYTMKTYTRLHCLSIEEIYTRLSLKQVTQNKKFQALIYTQDLSLKQVTQNKKFQALIYTRLSLKQVTQNKKFQALQSLRRVSNAWNSLLKNVTKN